MCLGAAGHRAETPACPPQRTVTSERAHPAVVSRASCECGPGPGPCWGLPTGREVTAQGGQGRRPSVSLAPDQEQKVIVRPQGLGRRTNLALPFCPVLSSGAFLGCGLQGGSLCPAGNAPRCGNLAAGPWTLTFSELSRRNWSPLFLQRLLLLRWRLRTGPRSVPHVGCAPKPSSCLEPAFVGAEGSMVPRLPWDGLAPAGWAEGSRNTRGGAATDQGSEAGLPRGLAGPPCAALARSPHREVQARDRAPGARS